MKFAIVSDFVSVIDSGAAGSIYAINRGLEALGHTVVTTWGTTKQCYRIHDELFGKAVRLHHRAHSLLQQHRDVDVLVISQPYAFKAFSRLRKEFPNVLFVNRTHGWEARGIQIQNQFGWEPAKGVGRWLRPISQSWIQRLCRCVVAHSDLVVTACAADSDWIKKTYCTPEDKVQCIPYGIEVDELPSENLDDSQRTNTFVFAGNYLERKGGRVLNQLLPRIGEQYPNVTLEMFVDATSVPALDSRLRPTWKNRARISPWVDRNELCKAFSRSKYLLLPSYFEGYGKTTIEALAMGCLILGFREGHLSNVDCRLSNCVEVGDIDGFRHCLENAASGTNAFPSDAFRLAVQVGRARRWRDTALEFAETCFQARTRLGRNHTINEVLNDGR